MKRFPEISIAIFVLSFNLATAQVVRDTARVNRRPVSRNTVSQIEALAPALSRHAAIVFYGRVVAISPIAESGGASSLIRITFQVENGLRGIQTDEQFQLLEWPGRWQAGEQYRIGERYLLFLHAPTAGGITSPVGGSAGRFLVDPNGTVDISTAQLLQEDGGSEPVSSPSTDPPPRTALPRPGTPNANRRIHTE